MIDETDISSELKWHYELLSVKAVEALRRNYFGAVYAPNRDEAFAKVLSMITREATIGIGDSITLEQLGIISFLENNRPDKLFNPFRRDVEGQLIVMGEERFQLTRKALTADIFMTGTNAITLDGKLVNRDGRGNRVAAMIFGPREVIVVAGANKIVKNTEEALRRISEVCAPLNAKRHLEKHHFSTMGELPCVRTGICNDCKSPWRICCYTVIIECQRQMETEIFGPAVGPPRPRISVVLVGESLGI